MALALSHPVVMSLTGPQLAAYIAALVCCDVIRRPMSVWTPYMVRAWIGGEGEDVLVPLEGSVSCVLLLWMLQDVVTGHPLNNPSLPQPTPRCHQGC